MERDVRLASVLSALDLSEPLDEDGELLTFGPFFGGETLTVVHRRLVELGLVYVDDFFDLFMDHPEWLEFRVAFVRAISK